MILNKVFMILLCAGLVCLSGCSSVSTPSDPKGVVIAMFGSMEKNDKATLAHLLDLAALMESYKEDYALHSDTPRVFTNPEQILLDLTGDGLTKSRWFSMQRIVGEVKLMDEAATVDVTFMDKAHSHAYLTTFGLHKVNGRWKIYSFKTVQSDS